MNVIRKRCGGNEGLKKFIDAVKLHPTVWMHSIDKDADLDAGSVDWWNSFEEIIDKLGWRHKVSVESARLAWKQLRMQYSKERRDRLADKMIDCNGSDSKWEIFERMTFMDRVIVGILVYQYILLMKETWIYWVMDIAELGLHFLALYRYRENGGEEMNNRKNGGTETKSHATACCSSSQDTGVDSGKNSDNGSEGDCNTGSNSKSSSSKGVAPSRKRKLSQSQSSSVLAVDKSSKSEHGDDESLNSALEAVTELAVKREMKKLGETDATQPLKLPSFVKSQSSNSNSSNKINSPASLASQKSPRIVRLSMKALESLSSAKRGDRGAFGTNYKFIKTAATVSNGTATTSQKYEPSKFIVDGKSGTTKIFKVIKTNSATGNVASVVKKTVQSDSNTSSVTTSTSVPRTKTIEETLTNLVAHAPSVSEIDGSVITTSNNRSYDEVIIPSLSSAPSDSKSVLNNASHPSCFPSKTVAQQQVAKEQSSAVVEQESKKAKTLIKEEHASCSLPSTSASTHSKSAGDSSDTQPATLMSVLQQCLGTSIDMKEMELMQPSSSNDLFPAISSSPLRIPSSNDVITGASRTPPIVIRPRAVSATAQVTVKSNQPPSLQSSPSHPGITVTSSSASTSATTSKASISTTTTPLTLNNCQYGRLATLVRVTSGNGSTFKLIRAPPKLVPSPCSFNGRVIKASTSKAVDGVNNSGLDKSSSSNNKNVNDNRKQSNEDDSSSPSSKAIKKVNQAVLRNKCASASSNNITTERSDDSPSRPLLKAINVVGSNQQSAINDSVANSDNDKRGTEASRDSSPDCAPPSLSTRFTPAPKQPDPTLTYLHKAVIRSLLLFQGPFFTIGDFRLRGPAVVRTVDDDKLKECLVRLLDDGLLRRIDDHLDLTDPEAAFEKERIKAKLIKLSDYGITKQQYATALERIVETAGLFLKK
ncbi:unnamed protein product [Anisakis simplex]|uniref:MADF domain-containing protein n=1 Tax=Anisakis simplex TaxID=6269 RepID=A0A0M3K0V8_ANISI|nr:unnamed protein product [Anisakis simplex]